MPGADDGPDRWLHARPWPRLVLFDLDDTLCDYSAARLLRLKTALAGPDPSSPLVDGATLDRAIEASLAVQPHGSDHFAELFAVHGIGDREAARWADCWYRANRFHGLELFPEALAAIAGVRGQCSDPGFSVRIGLITNGPADMQREKIELLGVAAVVDFVLVSGEFGAWKPDPAIFAEALRLAAAQAQDAVMVGDSLEHDIAGANAVGIRSLWVNRHGLRRGSGDPRPDAEIRSVADVPAVLTQWRTATSSRREAM